MNESFYIAMTTAIPVLLLSSTFAGLQTLERIETRTDRVANYIAKAIAVVSAALSAFAFALCALALMTQEPLTRGFDFAILILVVCLFGASTGINVSNIVMRRGGVGSETGLQENGPDVTALTTGSRDSHDGTPDDQPQALPAAEALAPAPPNSTEPEHFYRNPYGLR